MNKKYVLQANEISFQYTQKKRNPLQVLASISLNLEYEQSIAIVGSSGSGKSTLLHVLGGLDKPTTGEVILCGKEFSNIPDKRRTLLRASHLGFVYQFHHLLPEFTALENVAMPLLIKGESQQKAKSEAALVLKEIGLSDRMDHKPAELSGGERQRAAIARALVHRPDCLLADEPTGNLDEKNALGAFNLMQKLIKERGGAMIVVTHDLELASRMDQKFNLVKGKLS